MNEVTTDELKAASLELRAAKTIYDDIKKKSNDAYAEYQQAQKKVMDLMEQADLRTFITDAGRITLKSKMSVRTPKTVEQKEAVFGWINENLGPDALSAYQTINSQTLNSLYNQLNEQYAAEGKQLNIPGLEAPIESTILSFTKA